jgi:tetratricopeptide (TPR) repeat protein
MKTRLRGVVAVVLLALGWESTVEVARGAEGAAPTFAASGLAALKEGRFAEARQGFLGLLSSMEQGEDAAGLAEAHFYLGLTDQQQAGAGVEEARRLALLESALVHYREALAKGPESAGILNNLARVQASLGRTNAALMALSRAVELNDSRRGFYAENYADLLLQAGRWRDACRLYAMVAGEQPQNRSVHRKMVDACVQQGPDLLAWYLWELAEAGQVAQVLDSALGVMRNPVWSRAQREELMGLVAHGLSRKNETLEEFWGTAAARALRELSEDPVVGEGVKGLLHLYEPGALDARRIRWWTRLVRAGEEPRRGRWPFESFLGLVRSLGERAGVEGQMERQEAYWLLAVGAKPGAPDPEALWLLANHYSDRREVRKLDALMQQHEVGIFQGKGEAYSTSQTEKIYRYHMALGVIYSQLDRWKSSRQVDSALFQLQRAMETADHLNAKAAAGGGGGGVAGPVVVPTRLVDLLASGYDKTGQADQAIRVRFDQAEKYLKLNQTDAAARVMAPLKARAVDPALDPDLPAGVRDSYRARVKAIDEKIARGPVPLASTPTGNVRVRVAPEASVVAGGANRRTLSEVERRTIETSIGNVVQTMQGKAGIQGKGSAFRTLGTNGVAPEVQEVTVTGNRGRVLLRQGTNLVQVPFQVDGAADNAKKKVRYVRP